MKGTYIIETMDGFYCGYSEDISKRLKQHRNEKYPHWFCNINRQLWNRIIIFENMNIEKRIKSFGIMTFIQCLDEQKESPVP